MQDLMGVKPYLRIKAASRATGLSEYFLRAGCRTGSIPHVRCGRTYMIDMVRLLRQLGADDPMGGERNGDGSN